MNEIEIVKHLQIDGVHIFFDTLDYRTPHAHRDFELIFVLENTLIVQRESKKSEISPGEIILFSPHQVHEFYKKNLSCTFLGLQLSPQIFAASLPSAEQIEFETTLPHEALTTTDFLYLKQLLLNITEAYLNQFPGYELWCVGQLHLLMHLLITKIPHRVLTNEERARRHEKSERIFRLLHFVDQNYMHKINLSDFATEENVSLSYLSRLVKETFGQNFQQYVNTVRFHAAYKQITSGKKKMLDICLESGFSDYRYFSKAFQQRLGMTPEAFRKQKEFHMQNEIEVHHSIHSLEKFYSRKKSIQLLNSYKHKF